MNPPQLSETALALELAERHGADFRYVADTGQSLHWTGTVWELDHEAAKLAHCASVVCCRAASGETNAKLARSLASRRTQQAVVHLIQTDPRFIVTHKQLDADPLLLGTPDGVVDLRTGELQPARREDLITMSTSVLLAPAGTPHPKWDDFLSTTFPRVPGQRDPDHEMIKFLQRWSGYSATGLTTKHHFAFFLGRGRNGKGVLFNTLRHTFGEYACALSSESLMERNVQPHRQEFATLRGKRLILSSEISAGRRWNEAVLNQLSGGDPITANFMRQNSFTFDGVGKLWVSANNMPAFHSVDTHLTERLILIWMRMRFLESVKGHESESDVAEQNQDLTELLVAEHPAILRWTIDGALAALRTGLDIPDDVRIDSQSYLDTEDALGNFISVNCTSISDRSPLSGLFTVWNICRREEQEKPYTLSEFRKLIETRYRVKRGSQGMMVLGLALNDTGRMKLEQEKQREARVQEQLHSRNAERSARSDDNLW